MPRTIRAALLQAEWTGDKDTMIEKHEKYAREAAKQGAQVMCFQELFYGPYFCQVQDPEYFSYTEHIPDGPTTKRMQELARETGMVLIVPMYEEDATGPVWRCICGWPGSSWSRSTGRIARHGASRASPTRSTPRPPPAPPRLAGPPVSLRFVSVPSRRCARCGSPGAAPWPPVPRRRPR